MFMKQIFPEVKSNLQPLSVKQLNFLTTVPLGQFNFLLYFLNFWQSHKLNYNNNNKYFIHRYCCNNFKAFEMSEI